MTTRKSSLSMIRAATFALVLSAPLISFAQLSTNTATAAAPTNAAEESITPAAPAAPADTTTSTEPRPTTYTVVSKDSLWKIAHSFGITVVELRNANNLKKGALLHPGQVLQIPPAKDDSAAK